MLETQTTIISTLHQQEFKLNHRLDFILGMGYQKVKQIFFFGNSAEWVVFLYLLTWGYRQMEYVLPFHFTVSIAIDRQSGQNNAYKN